MAIVQPRFRRSSENTPRIAQHNHRLCKPTEYFSPQNIGPENSSQARSLFLQVPAYCGGVVGTPGCGGAGAVPFGACWRRVAQWLIACAPPARPSSSCRLNGSCPRSWWPSFSSWLLCRQPGPTGQPAPVDPLLRLRRPAAGVGIELRPLRFRLLGLLGAIAVSRLLFRLGVLFSMDYPARCVRGNLGSRTRILSLARGCSGKVSCGALP